MILKVLANTRTAEKYRYTVLFKQFFLTYSGDFEDLRRWNRFCGKCDLLKSADLVVLTEFSSDFSSSGYNRATDMLSHHPFDKRFF